MRNDFLPSNLDGDRWEDLCHDIYRIRYKDDNYQEIEASHGGDSGIEGFTSSGIVIQCYCPEKDYGPDELYGKVREKITKDVNKLLDIKNIKKQKSWGIKKIKQWHFLTPDINDSRVLEHLEKKRKFITEEKKKHPKELEHISDDIILPLKRACDFNLEIYSLLRNKAVELELDLMKDYSVDTDWSNCDSEKSENVHRKIRAIMSEYENDDIKEMIDFHMNAYVHEIEISERLRTNFPRIYEDLQNLKISYKNTVSRKTKMKSPKEENVETFYKIMEEFQKEVEKKFNGILNDGSIVALNDAIISSWLADCSMEFKIRRR